MHYVLFALLFGGVFLVLQAQLRQQKFRNVSEAHVELFCVV